MKEKEFQLHHTRLVALCSEHFDTRKADDTILLALHGWLDNAASFENLMQATSSWTWCAIDFSGHGLSDHRPSGCFYHLWDYVLDIVQLIEKLDVEGANISLVGHSMGGAIAMLVAAVIPEKIKNLILLDNIGPLTAESSERVSRLRRSIRSMEKIQQRKGSKSYSNQKDMIEARMNGFTSLDFSAAQKLVLRDSKLNADDQYEWRHDQKLKLVTPFSMDEESVNAFAEKITCPMLLLLAKEGVYSKDSEAVERRLNFFPAKAVEWLEGGHHFHLEDATFARTVSSIKSFIKNT